MSLTRMWPILLVVLKVVMGSPTETGQEASHNLGVKENGVGLRHVRATNQNGGGLGLDDASGGYSGVGEDPSDPSGGSIWGSEEELSSTTTAVVVPLSVFKILAPDTLKYLRPISSKSVIENSAKWFLPPSLNMMSGGTGGVGGGFPRYSRADSNFIRFGRSHNSGIGGYIGTNNKKNNFIRLGRENPRQNNFIRLGRSAENIGTHEPFRFGKSTSMEFIPEGSLDGGPKRISLDSNGSGFPNDQNSIDSPHRIR